MPIESNSRPPVLFRDLRVFKLFRVSTYSLAERRVASEDSRCEDGVGVDCV